MTLATYQVIAYCLVGLTMVLFGFTAGFDLGIGTLLPFIGKNNDERRIVINSIGPTWDGNQVWLVILGGVLFILWPYAYALVFSALYWAMILFLWALFLRPVAFEWRSKIDKTQWRTLFDVFLFLGSGIPAIAIGLVLGNLMIGLPFHYETDSLRVIYTGSFWQLINPFALLVAFTSLCLLLMHGSTYLRVRTLDVINARCRKATMLFGLLFIISFSATGIWIASGLKGYVLIEPATLTNIIANKVSIQPSALLQNYHAYPWMKTAPIVTFIAAGIAIIGSFFRRMGVLSFWGSGFAVIGAITTFGFSMFPFITPSSTMPNHSLTAWNASATHYALHTIFVAIVIFFPTIGLYTIWAFRKIWGPSKGKITLDKLRSEDHSLY